MKKTWYRLLLDLVMLVGLASLYSDKAISMAYHEIGGLVLGGVFLLHLVFNFRWIKRVFVKVFSRGVLWRTRILALVDVLLLVSWAMVILSGAFISKVVFSLRVMGQWKMYHFFFSGLSLILTGIHLGFHGKYLAVNLKKLVPVTLPRVVKLALVAILSVAILVPGVMNYKASGVERWLSMPFGMTAGGPSGEMRGPSGEMNGRGAVSGETETVKPTAEPDPNPPVAAQEPEIIPEPAAEEASYEPVAEESASDEPEQDSAASGEMTRTRPSGEMRPGGASGEMSVKAVAASILRLAWEFGSVVLAAAVVTGWIDWLCLWAKKRIRAGKKST